MINIGDIGDKCEPRTGEPVSVDAGAISGNFFSPLYKPKQKKRSATKHKTEKAEPDVRAS